MKTARELELSLLVKEAHIQQLKLKVQELLSDNINIAELNIKLLNKINKAIEYIENNDLYYQDVDYDYEENMTLDPPSDEEARAILLSILKGEDNE